MSGRHAVACLIQALAIVYDEILQSVAVLVAKPLLDVGFGDVVGWKSLISAVFVFYVSKH